MKSSDFQARKRFDLTATIAISTTTSGAVDLAGTDLIAILLPAAMTGTSIKFQASVDGTNFYDIYDGAGALASITTAADHYVQVPASVAPARWLKLVSGSTELAERTIQLITKASA